MNYKIFILIGIICFFISVNTYGDIPKSVKAKSEYALAKKKYDEKNFESAAKHLRNVRSFLGKTNSKIQYMLVKSLFQANKYVEAEEELKSFFEVTSEAEASTDQYNEMVILVAELAEKQMQ